MNRDPFYQQIIDGLSKVTDGNLFEACAVDLLRPDWPTMLPVPGGGDAGVDGAWVDEKGHGLLIATTDDDVIGNVTKSLKSHLASGGMRRRVLVATTQALTARRCFNIEKRIHDLGFELVHHPYTSEAFGNLLYRNSRWCRELLGIAGLPPALSRVSKGVRPLRDLPLIGRAEDLKWLESTQGDRVIVGQPGIGKSYLEQAYVALGHGLFATEDDLSRLAGCLRDQSPSAIIIEDAQLRLELLEGLRRLCAETGLTFDIVADCWPTDAAPVCHALALGNSKCRTLEPLSQKQIVELINAGGVYGPSQLMHQIIQQAVGCPGRAAMLVHQCLSDDVQDVWLGTALGHWARATFGSKPLQILAGFAIGGKAGTPIDVVAQLLGYPAGEILGCMATLGHGGVVHVVTEGVFAVLPEPLRCVLVKEYFFDSAAPLPLDRFLALVPSRESALHTLIGAYGRGARVTRRTLVELLTQHPASDAWEQFVWVDPSHADVVLNEFPDRLIPLARPLLHQTPERTIPLLLDAARGDERPLHSTTNHPLRLIEDWVQSAPQGTGESVRRRRMLWDSVKGRLGLEGERSVGLRTLKPVLSPDYDDHEPVPGSPRSFTIMRGVLRLEELRQLATIWPDVFQVLKVVPLSDWTPVLESIDQWVYCGRSAVPLSADYIAVFQSTAREMLRDLSSISLHRPGVQKQLSIRAGHIDLTMDVTIDRAFSVLYPEEEYDTEFVERNRLLGEAAAALAEEWLPSDPHQTAVRIALLAREAKTSGRNYPDLSGYLCNLIAGKTSNPMLWLDALIAADADAQHLLPFADRVTRDRVDGWANRLETCLQDDRWRGVGVQVLLKEEVLDHRLLEMTIEAAKTFPTIVEHGCFSGQLCEARIIRLLDSGDAALAESAAIGLWHREPKGSIPTTVQSSWRKAVISCVRQGHYLREMMEQVSGLAYVWLLDRATMTRERYYNDDDVFIVAVQRVSMDERRAIIDNVDAKLHQASRVVEAVVGSSPEIYRHLLSKSFPEWLCRVPLFGIPTEEWATLAIVALDAGYSIENLASSAHGAHRAFTNSVAQLYEKRITDWAKLRSHADARVREIARLGEESARRECEQWQSREKKEQFSDQYL